MVTCLICNRDNKSYQALGIHIAKLHKIEKSEYYKKYLMKDPNEHICPVCGNENKIMSLTTGFTRTCSTKCGQNTEVSKEKRKKTNLERYGTDNPMKLSEFKNKLKETNLERYGVENAFQNKEIQDKQKETVRSKYGVDHIFQLDSTKQKYKNTMQEKYGVDNAFQMDDFNEKRERTSIEKYNTEYPCQSTEIKEKIKNINLEKFGETTPLKNEQIKEKIKETMIERYGHPHNSQTDSYKESYKNTSLKKYGTEHPLQSSIVRDKIKQTNLKKYGVEHTFQSESVKEKIKETMMDRYGAAWHSSSEIGKNERKKTIYDRMFKSERFQNKVTPIFNINEYNGIKYNNKYKFMCNKCFCEFQDNLADGRIPRCFNCYPVIMSNPRTSKGENEVYEFVKSILPENTIIIQNDRSLIKPLELDIYIPSHKLAIEFNGLYWHSEKQGKDQYYHFNKYSKCREKGFQLIQIFDDEWFNKQDIVCSIIADKLKVYENTYNVDDLTINKVPFKEAELFLDQNHIQGNTHRGFNYGLYDNNNLISMITIIKSNEYYEILRFCTKLNTNVVGGFQKLINNFTKDIQGSIITYSDLRYGYGNVYENSGFNLTHTNSPNYYYTNDYINRDSRSKFQKHKLNNLLESFDPTLTEWQNMQNHEYDRIWDCGNNVFEMKVA